MSATIELEDENLKASLLGLSVALIEIIGDTLKLQAIKRMEKGNLSEKEIERLGRALMNLEMAIEEIKEEQGVREAVKEVRGGLDNAVEDLLQTITLEKSLQHEKEDKNG